MITVVLLSGLVSRDTSALFDDSEVSNDDQAIAWVSETWIQTTPEDFGAGVPEDVNTTWMPGDVTLGVNEDWSDAVVNWYNIDWKYRKKITIDSTKVMDDLTGFPVLISFPSDSDLATNTRGDAFDILFTASDGVAKLSHEVEFYDNTTGQLVAWVKVPLLLITPSLLIVSLFPTAPSILISPALLRVPLFIAVRPDGTM